MADFNFLSQLQGPNIPVSIFGDAASQGIAAGNALPTKTTSIIKGALSGIEKGQEFVQNQQQIQLTQNKIEQIPVENEIRRQQLTNIQLANENDKLELALDTQTQALELESREAELKENISKNKDATDKRSEENAFIDAFKSASPQQQAQMVLSNQYAGIFANNPDLYKQSLQTVYLDPQSGISPDVRQRLGTMFKKASIQDTYAKNAQKYLPQYLQAESQLLEDPMTGQLLSNVDNKYSAQQIYNGLKLVPKGLYEVVPGTNNVRTRNGQPAKSPSFEGASPSEYDLYFVNPDTGRPQILGSVGPDNPDFKKKFDTWVGQRAIQDGSSLRAELREVDRQAIASQKPPPAQRSTPTFAAQPTSTSQATYLNEAQSILKLNKNQISNVQPILRNLEQITTQSALDPDFRNSASAKVNYATLKDNLSREIAYSTFESNPKLQEEYTPAKLEAYNRSLREEALNKFARDRSASPDTITTLLAPFLATDTRDLYYKINKTVIDQNIKYLENRYIQLANQRAAANRNKVTEKQSIMSSLQEGLGGSQ